MTSDPAWPAIGWEERTWTPSIPPELVSRRVRQRHAGPYRAALVPTIATRDVSLPTSVVAVADEGFGRALADIRRRWQTVITARREAVAWRVADLLLRQPVVDAAMMQRGACFARSMTRYRGGWGCVWWLQQPNPSPTRRPPT